MIIIIVNRKNNSTRKKTKFKEEKKKQKSKLRGNKESQEIVKWENSWSNKKWEWKEIKCVKKSEKIW